jgi:hypothetical protein
VSSTTVGAGDGGRTLLAMVSSRDTRSEDTLCAATVNALMSFQSSCIVLFDGVGGWRSAARFGPAVAPDPVAFLAMGVACGIPMSALVALAAGRSEGGIAGRWVLAGGMLWIRKVCMLGG